MSSKKPLRNEYVTSGNNSARIKNYYANGLLVLVEVNGEFKPGDIVHCQTSDQYLTLSSDFETLKWNSNYEPEKEFFYVQPPGYFIASIGDYTSYNVEPYTDYGLENATGVPWPMPDILTLLDNDSSSIDGGMGGPFIATDAHFTGNTLTQDYSYDNVIVVRTGETII